jgi:hypothetical protein
VHLTFAVGPTTVFSVGYVIAIRCREVDIPDVFSAGGATDIFDFLTGVIGGKIRA